MAHTGRYVIYALVCPLNNTIRYVGQTNNIQRRFLQHLSYKGHNLQLNAWIAALALDGYVPVCKTLKIVDTLQEALLQETASIAEYMASEPLYNFSA